MTTIEKLKVIFLDRFVVDAEKFQPGTGLEDDLDFDSLDRCELEMAVEDEFGICVDSCKFDDLLTVGDVVKYVDEALAEAGLASA